MDSDLRQFLNETRIDSKSERIAEIFESLDEFAFCLSGDITVEDVIVEVFYSYANQEYRSIDTKDYSSVFYFLRILLRKLRTQ